MNNTLSMKSEKNLGKFFKRRKSKSIKNTSKRSRQRIKSHQNNKRNEKSTKKKIKHKKLTIIYYIDQLIKASQEYNPQSISHFSQTLESIGYLNEEMKPHIDDILDRTVYLPPLNSSKKRTLILDMDETLIHTKDAQGSNLNVQTSIKLNRDETIRAQILIRPHLTQFLERVSEIYELVIFTASQACYANHIINMIDPKNKYFSSRIYRNNCVMTQDGVQIKDLRIFGNRNLEDIIIVDNAYYSYGFQPFNGVPIIPFLGDEGDQELLQLADFLECVSNIKGDISHILKKVFRYPVYIRERKDPERIIQKLIEERDSILQFLNQK